MSVSSTATFTMTGADIVDRAIARVGGEHTPGYGIKAARLNLQLLLTAGFNNRGSSLWLREWQTLSLSQGTGRYPLANDTIDVVQAILRENNGSRISVTLGADPITTASGSATVMITDTAHGAQIGENVNLSGATAVGGLTLSGDVSIAGITNANAYTVTASSAASSTATGGGSSITADYRKYTDLELGRISWDDYVRLPNKGMQGKPNSFAVERQRDNPVLYLYPVQDSTSTRYVAYLRKRRLLDVSQLADNADVPATFLLALISGLAALLAREVPNLQQVTGRSVEEFVADADRDWALAASENRDRAPVSLMPDFSRYTR